MEIFSSTTYTLPEGGARIWYVNALLLQYRIWYRVDLIRLSWSTLGKQNWRANKVQDLNINQEGNFFWIYERWRKALDSTSNLFIPVSPWRCQLCIRLELKSKPVLFSGIKHDFADYILLTVISNGELQQARTIVIHEDEEEDIITGCRQKTRYGRPEWNKIFGQVARSHPRSVLP